MLSKWRFGFSCATCQKWPANFVISFRCWRKHAISMGWLANSNRACSHFPRKCKARMYILCIAKVKILRVIQWSYRLPQLCSLLRLEWLISFEHVIQSLFNTSFWCPFLHLHPTINPSNIGVRLRRGIKLGTSTLWSMTMALWWPLKISEGLSWMWSLTQNFFSAGNHWRRH